MSAADDLSRFARPLPPVPGTKVNDEPLTLTPEAQTQVDEQLEAIRKAHAQALAHAHEVVVWR